uniref:Retrotransposon protein n=1 Tax=Cucumis melo TaxID=3656 RepID=A0A9I9CUP9_CUCME
MSDRNEELPSMYSQGIYMSQNNVCTSRPAHTSNGRAESSESKRNKGSQWEGELDVIHMALECTNDQLRTISEWSAHTLANDTHVRQEFLHLLHEMPDLRSLDRMLCQR